MTYISLFQDIYIAAKLKSDTDIIKGYDEYPLLAKSTPKNTLTITTSNSKNWDYASDDIPLVSSNTAASVTLSTNKILKTGAGQSLIFQLCAKFS